MDGLPRLNFVGQQVAKEEFEKGNAHALEDLLITGIPWVCTIAERYAENNPDEFLDYFQEGIIGLRGAIDKWKPEESPLASYSGYWISQAIRRYISSKGEVIRLPAHQYEKREKIIAEICKTGEIPGDVNDIELSSLLSPVSLNSDIYWIMQTSVKEQILNPKEINLPIEQNFFEELIDDKGLENEVTDRLYLKKVRTWFYNTNLTERQKYVVASRFGFDSHGDGKTLEEVGQVLGVTRERIRQIQQKAIRMLRHPKRKRTLQTTD